MSTVLPPQIDYEDQLPSLPADTQSIFVKSLPINGTTFTAGSQIFLDFVNRGFLIPDSIYLSYKLTAVTDASDCCVLGTPVFAPFSQSQVQIGSQTVDTVANYNVVMNTICNATLDVAQKYGNQSTYGWNSLTGTPPTLAQLDNRVLLQTDISGGIFMSAPLMNVLTNAERALPLFAMPQVRIVLSLDSIQNVFAAANLPIASGTTGVVTSYQVSNVELRYRIVDIPVAEQMVKAMGPKIYIKSQSFASTSQLLPSGASGFNELVFNSRFASLKGLIALNGGSASSSFTKQYDSFDYGNTEYSFSVGGQIFPQAPISSSQNKSTALMELKNCFGSIYEKTNSQSINLVEYNRRLADGSTYAEPAKFYIGVSTSKMDSDSNLLTGISTQNSPITYRLSIGTPLGSSSPITILMNYDALIEVDTVNRQCAVKT